MSKHPWVGKLEKLISGQAAVHNSGISVGVAAPLAKFYNDIQSAHDQVDEHEVGNVATFVDDNEVLHIVLLADMKITSTLLLTKNTVLHLNGHKIGAYSNFTFDAAHNTAISISGSAVVHIDGSGAGSMIEVDNPTSVDNASTRIIRLEGSAQLSIDNTHLRGFNSKGAQVFGISVPTGTAVTSVKRCKIECIATSKTVRAIAGTGFIYEVEDCEIISKLVLGGTAPAGSLAVDGLFVVGDANSPIHIKNCKIVCRDETNGVAKSSVKGIWLTAGTGVVENCDVSAAGSCKDGSAFGLYHDIGTKLYVKGGNYYGTRECIYGAAGDDGNDPNTFLFIDGGTFSGCQHGSGYFNGNTRAKNATFKVVPFTDGCGWVESHWGAAYFSAGTHYFDNCRFVNDVNATCSLRIKYSNPCKVYLSNVVCSGPWTRAAVGEGGQFSHSNSQGKYYFGANVPWDRSANGYLFTANKVDESTYEGQRFLWDEDTGEVRTENQQFAFYDPIQEKEQNIRNFYGTLPNAVAQKSAVSKDAVVGTYLQEKEIIHETNEQTGATTVVEKIYALHLVLIKDISLDEVLEMAERTSGTTTIDEYVLHLNGHTINVGESGCIRNLCTLTTEGICKGGLVQRICDHAVTYTTDSTAYNLFYSIGPEIYFYSIKILQRFSNAGSELNGTRIVLTEYECNLTMIDCQLVLENSTAGVGQLCAVQGNAKFKNCILTGTTLSGDIRGIFSYGEILEVDHCNISLTALKAAVKVHGVSHNWCPWDEELGGYVAGIGVCKITECNIASYGSGDTTDGKTYGCSAISGDSNFTIIGGSYYGSREAVSVGGGVVLIEGALFEGCQHGGAYFHDKVRVKNSTFRNSDYRGPEGFNHSRGGVIYTSTDAELYMDNCKIEVAEGLESKVTNGIVCNSRYPNIVVYLSNISFSGQMLDLRVDWGRVMYLGENVAYRGVNYGVNHKPSEYLTKGVLDETTYAGIRFLWDSEGNIPQFGQSSELGSAATGAGVQIEEYYNTFADLIAKTNPVKFGKLGTYAYDEATQGIVMFDNCEIPEPVSFEAPTHLRLNGYKIRVAGPAYILSNAPLTIDGDVANSEIYKTVVVTTDATTEIEDADIVAAVESYDYLIRSIDQLTLRGGTYRLSAGQGSDGLNFASCVIVASSKVICEYANIVQYSHTPVKQARGIWSTELDMYRTTVQVTGQAITSYGAYINGAKATNLHMDQSEVQVVTDGVGTSANGIYFYSGQDSENEIIFPSFLELENSTVKAHNLSTGANCRGVYSWKAHNKVKNCVIEAIGSVGPTESCTQPAAGLAGSGIFEIKDCNIFGTREGLALSGEMILIDGGVYEGCCHGNYLSNKIRAQNATFRNASQRSDLPFECVRLGVVYTGTDAELYMNNCRVESDEELMFGVIVNNRYENVVVYLSNIEFDGVIAADLRVDLNRTVYLGENVNYRNAYLYHTHTGEGDGVDPASEDVIGIINTDDYYGVAFTWDTAGQIHINSGIWAALTTNSGKTSFASIFANSAIREVPAITLRGSMAQTFSNCTKLISAGPINTAEVTNLTLAFRGCENLVTLKLTDIPLTAPSTFVGCTKLTNVKIGIIRGSVSFGDSTELTLESAKGICVALVDSNNTPSITLPAVVVAKLDEDGATSPDGTTWREYISSKGWTLKEQ